MTVEPTPKAPEVQRLLGETLRNPTQENFRASADAVHQLKSEAVATQNCVAPPIGCGKPITAEDLQSWGPMTIRESGITGLCGPCQVEIMGGTVND